MEFLFPFRSFHFSGCWIFNAKWVSSCVIACTLSHSHYFSIVCLNGHAVFRRSQGCTNWRWKKSCQKTAGKNGGACCFRFQGQTPIKTDKRCPERALSRKAIKNCDIGREDRDSFLRLLPPCPHIYFISFQAGSLHFIISPHLVSKCGKSRENMAATEKWEKRASQKSETLVSHRVFYSHHPFLKGTAPSLKSPL